MTPEVFISYSREDSEEIFPIVERLRGYGLNIWIDQEGIHGAKLWSQEIVNAIEDSKVFILFASVTAFASKNVTKELALASESDKHILPVFLEDAEIPAAMKYQLAGIQHLVHKPGDKESTVQSILKTLGTLDVEIDPNDSSPTERPTTTSTGNIQHPKTSRRTIAITIAALIIAVAVLIPSFLKNTNEDSTSIRKTNSKSTVHLGVTTYFSGDETNTISNDNRELRDKLVSKLSRFSDYEVIHTSPVSIDVDTKTIQSTIQDINVDYLIVSDFNVNNQEVNAKTYDRTGKIISVIEIDNSVLTTNSDSLAEESTSIISAKLAGYDAAIHSDILLKSSGKKESELSALELLARAKNVWNSAATNKAEISIQLLDKCISVNPNISSAHSVRGQIYANFFQSGDSSTNGIAIAKQSNTKASRIDPNNAMVILSKLWVSFHEKDHIASEQLAEQGLEANPNEPFLLATIAASLILTERDLEQGKEYIDKAIAYNSNPQDWYYMVLESYHMQNADYRAALNTSLRMKSVKSISNARGPTTPIYYWLLGEKQIALDRFKTLMKRIPSEEFEQKKNELKTAFENKKMGGSKVAEEMSKAFDELLEAYNFELSQNEF